MMVGWVIRPSKRSGPRSTTSIPILCPHPGPTVFVDGTTTAARLPRTPSHPPEAPSRKLFFAPLMPQGALGGPLSAASRWRPVRRVPISTAMTPAVPARAGARSRSTTSRTTSGPSYPSGVPRTESVRFRLPTTGISSTIPTEPGGIRRNRPRLVAPSSRVSSTPRAIPMKTSAVWGLATIPGPCMGPTKRTACRSPMHAATGTTKAVRLRARATAERNSKCHTQLICFPRSRTALSRFPTRLVLASPVAVSTAPSSVG